MCVCDVKEYFVVYNVIFQQESLLRHAILNMKERNVGGTAVYGINQFSDWTPEEFKGIYDNN